MAAKKKSASKKIAAAPKKPARAASKAAKDAQTGLRKPASATAKRTAKSAPGGSKSAQGGPEAGKRAPVGADRSGPKRSRVKGKTVDWYFDQAGGWQAEAMRRIHDMVVDTAEGVEHGIKWAQPVYEKYGPLAFLRAARQHVTLGFWRGAELIAPEGLLEGEGGRMKHVKIKSLAGIPGAVVDLVKQAVKLNEKKGDPTKKKA